MGTDGRAKVTGAVVDEAKVFPASLLLLRTGGRSCKATPTYRVR